MKTFIHGTNFESGRNIVTNGFIQDKNTIWMCSDPDMVYCRDAEDEDALVSSIESGQIAAAFFDSKSDKVAVVCINIPDELIGDLVEEDLSIEDAYNCYQIDATQLQKLIDSQKVTAEVVYYNNCYNNCLRAFYLANLKLDLLESLDDTLKKAVTLLSKHEIYLEEIMCPSYEEVYREIVNSKGIAELDEF